jgi:hypothetical protein
MLFPFKICSKSCTFPTKCKIHSIHIFFAPRDSPPLLPIFIPHIDIFSFHVVMLLSFHLPLHIVKHQSPFRLLSCFCEFWLSVPPQALQQEVELLRATSGDTEIAEHIKGLEEQLASKSQELHKQRTTHIYIQELKVCSIYVCVCVLLSGEPKAFIKLSSTYWFIILGCSYNYIFRRLFVQNFLPFHVLSLYSRIQL